MFRLFTTMSLALRRLVARTTSDLITGWVSERSERRARMTSALRISLMELVEAAISQGIPQGQVGGVTVPACMVDMVGSQNSPAELLEEVELFIGEAGRGEAGENGPSHLRPDLGQPAGHQGQGLLPGGLDQLSVFADEGRGQALRAVDVLPAEASLHAEVPLVQAQVLIGPDAHDLIVLRPHQQGAADSAIGAYRAGILQVPDPGLVEQDPVIQGAHGADGDTLAAEFAVEGPVEVGGDLGFSPPG